MFWCRFFASIGALAGLFAHLTQAYRRILESQYLTDPVTNLPNFRGLQQLVHIDARGMGLFAGVIVLKVHHISEIDKSLGPDSAEKLLKWETALELAAKKPSKKRR